LERKINIINSDFTKTSNNRNYNQYIASSSSIYSESRYYLGPNIRPKIESTFKNPNDRMLLSPKSLGISKPLGLIQKSPESSSNSSTSNNNNTLESPVSSSVLISEKRDLYF
jgi:hypothetical protein